MKPKKFLLIIGIALLLGTSGWGGYVFLDRHKNNELVTTTTPESSTTTPAESSTSPSDTQQQQPTAVVVFDKKKLSLSDPTSIWIIANKNRPLNPLTYAPADLVSAGNNQQMRSEAAAALTRLFAAAKSAGYTLSALSGYRSYSRQQTVYNKEVATYGQAVADTESAKPGYSEHQTGLAIDIGGGGCGIEDCFGTTAEGKWVAAHALEHGFIIRYPEGKQDITGYRYEPWHIRFVGTELAAEMHSKSTLTLEEFFNIK